MLLSLAIPADSLPSPSPSTVRLQGFDCQRPIQTRVIQAESACNRADIQGHSEPEVVQIIQRVPVHRFVGYKCKLRTTLRAHFCGFDSYTQELPTGHTARPTKISREQCHKAVTEHKYVAEDGKTHEVSSPGFSSFQIQRAGEERFHAGEMRCQGESLHLDGRFLRDVIAELEVQLEITREELEVQDHKVMSLADREELACGWSSAGCAGPTETFIWETGSTPCMFQAVSVGHGRWNADRSLFPFGHIRGGRQKCGFATPVRRQRRIRDGYTVP